MYLLHGAFWGKEFFVESDIDLTEPWMFFYFGHDILDKGWGHRPGQETTIVFLYQGWSGCPSGSSSVGVVVGGTFKEEDSV